MRVSGAGDPGCRSGRRRDPMRWIVGLPLHPVRGVPSESLAPRGTEERKVR